MADATFRERLQTSLASLAARGVYMGGSSWKYPGWIGQVYTEDRYLTRNKLSKKKFEAECLTEYAEVFPAVGGDFSFYNFPTGEQWARLFGQAPGLLFGLKAPEAVTVKTWPKHARYGSRSGAENDMFLNADLLTHSFLEPLAAYREQVGVVMLEFGTMSKAQYAEPGRFVEDLDAFLGALPPAFRYGVEIRNQDYLGPEYLGCLRAHNVAHVFNAWTRMPALEVQVRHPENYTADFTVARALLRRGRGYAQAVDAFEPYDRIQDPYPEVREGLAYLAQQSIERKQISMLFVNNRLEGNSPETMLGVAELVG